MSGLVTAEELPRWVPGDLTADSTPLAWDGLKLREYRYVASDVPVPALRDYVVVVYKEGATPIHRRFDGRWSEQLVAPGSVSVLTRAAPSHWRWSQPIEVAHLYISPTAIASIAAEVFDRDIEDVELADVLKAQDPVLVNLATTLDRELGNGGLGGNLYIDALRNQACVHILRTYATVVFRETDTRGALSKVQQRLVAQYVHEHIEHAISLADLASVARLSPFHFARKFTAAFGCPPHAYVMQQRIGHAQRQLADRHVPLKVIAANCGFADQSHMTRLFRRLLDVTPAEYRRAAVG